MKVINCLVLYIIFYVFVCECGNLTFNDLRALADLINLKKVANVKSVGNGDRPKEIAKQLNSNIEKKANYEVDGDKLSDLDSSEYVLPGEKNVFLPNTNGFFKPKQTKMHPNLAIKLHADHFLKNKILRKRKHKKSHKRKLHKRYRSKKHKRLLEHGRKLKIKKRKPALRTTLDNVAADNDFHPNPPIIIIEKKLPIMNYNDKKLEVYTKNDHQKAIKKDKTHHSNDKKIKQNIQLLSLLNVNSDTYPKKDFNNFIHQGGLQQTEKDRDKSNINIGKKSFKVYVNSLISRGALMPYFKKVKLTKRIVPKGFNNHDLEYDQDAKGLYKPLLKLSEPGGNLGIPHPELQRLLVKSRYYKPKLAWNIDRKRKIHRREGETEEPKQLRYDSSYEVTKRTTKAPRYNFWNYWSYKKLIYEDNCPQDQVKYNDMCIRIPEHRKRHVFNRVKYLNKKLK